MSNYYLGLDNGGTLIKAVLFDEKGEPVCSASKEMPLSTPHVGYTERDMNELFEANCECIRKIVETCNVPAEKIAAVACAGHGKGLYLWGKDDKPAYPGIVSTDTRAAEIIDEWKKEGIDKAVFEKTWQSILVSQPVAILAWFKRHNPAVYANIKWILSVKDYIRFRLTGVANSEYTDASGTNLMNLNSRQYDDELLKIFGIEEVKSALPPLKSSCDCCGYVTKEVAEITGLAQGTPVAGGMFDIDACAIAQGVIDSDNICVVAGTWSINEYISKVPVTDKSVLMNSIFCLPEFYLVEECSPTSAGNHKWFMDMFASDVLKESKASNKPTYALADEMAMSVDISEDVPVFLPFLYGSNYNPNARASLVGMNATHKMAHVIRAVMEGIVYCHMEHIDALLKNRTKPNAIRLCGGASRSDFWVQMFADISNLPIERTHISEPGAMGAAMCAAVCAGHFKDLSAAVKSMVRVDKAVQPNAENNAVYVQKREKYTAVSRALDDVWSMFN